MWLICAATQAELNTWLDTGTDTRFPACRPVVSGVGIPQTIATLLPLALSGDYSLLVNIGIAGAYPQCCLGIGDIVIADGEVYGDLGMELPEEPWFQPLAETPFGAAYAQAFPTVREPALSQPGTAHRRGATVNACAGSDATGRRRETLFGAAFETMEGAAVAQVGQIADIPVCEIRAISNIAARRDMRIENIRIALRKLHEYLALRAR